MFDKILVPLDGSPHGDEVLAQVKRILQRKDAKVTLLGVIVPLLEKRGERGDRKDQSERHIALRKEELTRHLDQLREGLSAEGVQVTSHVVMGDPTEAILKQVEEEGIDLVAMATHGRSGPSRWVRGSTAERVLRRCPVPVLMCNPRRGDGEVETRRFQRILVPVDGSRQAEEILPLVVEVGGLYDSEVVLLRVKVQPLDPYYSLPWANEDLEDSLERYHEQLTGKVREVRRRTRVGDPAVEILAAVEEEQADVVAMTTHGLSGLSRWLFGSVAEKVLRACGTPLLLKRTGLQEP